LVRKSFGRGVDLGQYYDSSYEKMLKGWREVPLDIFFSGEVGYQQCWTFFSVIRELTKRKEESEIYSHVM
jgi:hypothetical protein